MTVVFRSTLLAALLVAVGSTVAASMSVAEIARGLSAAHFRNMVVAYWCREVVGISFYYNAIRYAETGMEEIGYSPDEAVLNVDVSKRQIEAIHPPDDIRPDSCLILMNDALHEIDVWQARYRLATGS